MHHGAQPGFTLDDGVRDSHFLAECGQEDYELDGVDVVGDEDQCRFFVFDQADDVVKAVFDGVGLLADVFFLFAFGDRGGFFLQALDFLGGGLGLVFGEEFEGLCGEIAV